MAGCGRGTPRRRWHSATAAACSVPAAPASPAAWRTAVAGGDGRSDGSGTPSGRRTPGREGGRGRARTVLRSGRAVRARPMRCHRPSPCQCRRPPAAPHYCRRQIASCGRRRAASRGRAGARRSILFARLAPRRHAAARRCWPGGCQRRQRLDKMKDAAGKCRHGTDMPAIPRRAPPGGRRARPPPRGPKFAARATHTPHNPAKG